MPEAPVISHRLLVSPQRWARLRALPEHPLLNAAAATLDRLAESWAANQEICVDETAHNAHLVRARHAQARIVSLLVQYGRTGDRRFREAALDYLRAMGEWEYWSWIAWRERNSDPNAIFDLSYGENSLTLALAYDWLAAELSPAEREMIIGIARARALQPYLACNGVPGKEMWYYRSPDCNWNTVCNGGAGTLTLALGEACPESRRVLELVEEGIRHYFEFMQEDGAWPEGIGYWGYGHRYGYYYLLSHERATGKAHPLLERPGSRATLRFPLLFSPNNVPASFGDVNHFFPLPFHYAAAERYGMGDVMAELDRRMLASLAEDAHALEGSDSWPSVAELLLFHPGESPSEHSGRQWPCVATMRGLEWSYLADQWPQPRLYASVRGGTTEAPHTHQDLTSLFVIVGEERLIENVGVDDYLDTTFGPRRFELYETSAASKNVFLVNGVGLPHPATISTAPMAGAGWEGVWLDTTTAMAVGSPVRLSGRAVLMLEGKALLVLDRAVLQHAALAEQRWHTFARLQSRRTSALVRGKQERLHLAFAANVPARLKRGLGLPTHPPRDPDAILR